MKEFLRHNGFLRLFYSMFSSEMFWKSFTFFISDYIILIFSLHKGRSIIAGVLDDPIWQV
jgi:hypothetical protein